jgi:hypothetical protein
VEERYCYRDPWTGGGIPLDQKIHYCAAQNTIGKAFPIEYGGVRVGIVPRFKFLGVDIIRNSLAFWRSFTKLPMCVGPAPPEGGTARAHAPLSTFC